MAPLTTTARACLRAASRAPLSTRAVSTSAALCASSSYSSPFTGDSKGNYVPDFSKYKTGGGENSNKLFSYFTVGAMGAISAAGAKSTVQGGLGETAMVRAVAIHEALDWMDCKVLGPFGPRQGRG